MFKKKKEIKTLEIPKNLQIKTIPEEFYAGADPTVKFKKTEKVVDLTKIHNINTQTLKTSEQKSFNNQTAKGSWLTSTKTWIIGAIILFVLFLIGAGIYYWVILKKESTRVVIPPPQIPVTTIEQPENLEIEKVEDDEELEETEEFEDIIEDQIKLTLPHKLVNFAVDVDNDGISDAAELFFGSDPGNPDTDGDGYSDGQELYYLYNPGATEPEKLLDSDFIKIFRDANFNFELYYPESWVVGAVDKEGQQVLFSTLTGEYIEVQTLEREIGQTQLDWLEKHLPNTENLSHYTDFTSRFNASGQMRKDGLAYFIFSFDKVFSLIYHLPDFSDTVNYRSVLMVMARSFYIGSSLTDKPNMVLEENVSENYWPFEDLSKIIDEEIVEEKSEEELEEESDENFLDNFINDSLDDFYEDNDSFLDLEDSNNNEEIDFEIETNLDDIII